MAFPGGWIDAKQEPVPQTKGELLEIKYYAPERQKILFGEGISSPPFGVFVKERHFRRFKNVPFEAVLQWRMRRGKPIVYISGPGASHNSQYRTDFNVAQWRLDMCGFAALNMANALPPELPHKEAMEICRTALEKADAVLMLENWRNSIGATEEYNAAKELGIPVFESVEECVALMKH